jgi:hypothetical protein
VHAMLASGVTINFSDPMKMLQFPLSMGTSGNDTHYSTFVSGGVTFTRSGTTSWEVDGYGTVTTPNGTYTNVLRVHQTQIYTDTYQSGVIDYNVDIYLWIKAGIHFPVASMTDVVTTLSDYNYGSYYSGTAALDEVSAVSFEVFPNPAQEELHVIAATHPAKEVIISDLSGKVVTRQVPIEQIVDLREMLPGMYLVQIVLEDGSILAAQRIVKQ